MIGGTALDLGGIMLYKVDGRGFTPEELAEQALARIIHIGDKSDPAIRAQAHAFREQLRGVLVEYMRRAVRAERDTAAGKLRNAGFERLVHLLEN